MTNINDSCWSDRQFKHNARLLATANNRCKSSASCALFLPSDEFCCCFEAMKTGIIDLRTNLILVEKDQLIFDNVRRRHSEFVNAGKLSSKAVVFNTELSRADLSRSPEIDYAFVDWFDELSPRNYYFLQNSLTVKLAKGADVAITLCTNHRSNNFAKAFDVFIQDQEVSRVIKDKLYEYWPFMVPPKISRILASLLFVFNDYEFLPQVPYYYHDTCNVMLLARFNDMVLSGKSIYPKSLVADFDALLMDYLRKEKITEADFNCERPKYELKSTTFSAERKKGMTGKEIAIAMMEAKTSGKKAAATKMLNAYVDIQSQLGKEAKWVIAGIRAYMTRLRNGN